MITVVIVGVLWILFSCVGAYAGGFLYGLFRERKTIGNIIRSHHTVKFPKDVYWRVALEKDGVVSSCVAFHRVDIPDPEPLGLGTAYRFFKTMTPEEAISLARDEYFEAFSRHLIAGKVTRKDGNSTV